MCQNKQEIGFNIGSVHSEEGYGIAPVCLTTHPPSI